MREHYEDLRQKYREEREKINADPGLNYETKQRRIRAAGLEYDRERRELERTGDVARSSARDSAA